MKAEFRTLGGVAQSPQVRTQVFRRDSGRYSRSRDRYQGLLMFGRLRIQ